VLAVVGRTYIVVKWAGPFSPPWTMVFFRLLLATLCLLPFAYRHFQAMATQLRARLVDNPADIR
jgi:drug/metabolite transporter (DMT)-like permease